LFKSFYKLLLVETLLMDLTNFRTVTFFFQVL